MRYDLTAKEILEQLGLNSTEVVDWMETLQQNRQIPLPKVYRDFMKLAANAPLFATSDLWVGKMSGVTLTPFTLYDRIREEISAMQSVWEKYPEERKGDFYKLSQLSEDIWPQTVKNYLLIGSEYGGGSVNFGILLADLEQDDPPVYWSSLDYDIKKWKKAAPTLSEFFKEVLYNILSCIDYDTPEDALEPYGWQFEEYCDEELDDFIAPPAEIRKLGIKIKQVKYHTSHDEEIKIFICYDEVRNIFFIGNVENKEIDLYAIYRTGTEDVFLQEENTH